jgi:hypothetical protein
MNAIDTNVFAYTFDPADPAKQAAARQLLSDLVLKPQETVLLWICRMVRITTVWSSSTHSLEVRQQALGMEAGEGTKPSEVVMSRSAEKPMRLPWTARNSKRYAELPRWV